MKQFFTQLFTGKDNSTIDLGRILWAKMCLVYCGATIFAIYKGQVISYEMWGVGAGALLAAGAGGLALKAKTEPTE